MKNNIVIKIFRLVVLTLLVIIFGNGTGWADFSYTIRNPNLKSAEQYVTSTSNINIRTEGNFTYFCPAKGATTMEEAKPGVIRYHFSFADPISEASLYVRTDTFHWKYSQGYSYVFASIDGRTWIKLAEAPPPEYGKWRSGNASGSLPAVFIGKKDIYVTVMLYSYGPSAASGGVWCNTAQHLRYDKNSNNVTFQLEVKNAAVPVAEFRAEVNGVDVNFDWSAMPAANSYSMAVAFADESGGIDIGSLKLINMGNRTTFSTFGLPSGMIFYVAIIANTNQGPVVSNMVKFMPIAGTVTGPGVTDGVLTYINDPGGLGQITLFGSIAGNDVFITRLSGNDGSGPFVLDFTDNKPATYTKGGSTMTFKNLADGSITIENLRQENMRASLSDCQVAINEKMAQLKSDFTFETGRLTGITRILSDFAIGAYGSGNINSRCMFLAGLFQETIKDLRIKFAQDMATLKKQYDECQNEPEPDPDPGIVVDLSCPVPPGAEYVEDHFETSSVARYTLNGDDVGPWRWWGLDAGSNTYLRGESCKNAAGQLNGWAVFYYESGTMRNATHYKDGVKDGHGYFFYCDGTVYRDETYVNDVRTYVEFYDGSGALLSYCNCAGDGVTHVVGQGKPGPLDCE